MGFKLALFAVPVGEKDDVLSSLALTETDQADPYSESPFCGVSDKNGNYIIWKNADDGGVRQTEFAALKSASSSLIMTLHEGVMSGDLTQFENGQLSWKIIYRGDGSLPQFETKGDVPNQLLTLYEQLKEKQVAEDASDDDEFHVDHIFEILSQSFVTATGFKYDDDHGLAFVTLAPDNDHYLRTPRPWWKFWAKPTF